MTLLWGIICFWRIKMNDKFVRNVDDGLINNLKAEPLWKNHLEPDCKKGEVFLAIRDKAIDFYYQGGRLFKYANNGFGTDLKYASVIDTNKEGLISENKLQEFELIKEFASGYSKIKDRCKNYANDEAKSVSSLYSKYSCVSGNNVFVLDTEIAFSSLQAGSTQDRIDLLLYDTGTKVLHFVEAKKLSDGRLVSRKIPEVIGQLERYSAQIQEREKEIVSQYCLYIDNLNTIFGIKLPHPQKVEKDPILWIFDFNTPEKEGKLDPLKSNPNYKGIKIYAAGNVGQTTPEKIINAKPC
jgi:hypothetical protein